MKEKSTQFLVLDHVDPCLTHNSMIGICSAQQPESKKWGA
jgi:hypothetical protein